jgi:hypothetical protein
MEMNKLELNYSEITYIYACWKQAYKTAYPNFNDYLKVALRGKEIKGTVYE